MRFHRIIGVLVAVATAVLVAPASAFADPYPAVTPPAAVSDGTVPEGGKVTFSGSGFLPFERISIAITFAGADSSAAFRPDSAGGFVAAALRLPRQATLVVTADSTGAFSVQVPLSQVGSATLVATGLTSGVTVTAHVEVVAPPGDDNDSDDGDGGDNGDGDNGGGNDGGGNDDGRDTGDGDDRDGALPTTGQSGTRLLTTVLGGAAAVLLGAVLLRFARRRRAGVRRR